MTHTTEQLEAMLAAATPGVWGFETVTTLCGVCHKIGPWPHQWRGGSEMSACIYDDYPPTSSGTANMKANATLIAAAPTITAELIAARRKLDAAEGLSMAAQGLGAMPEGYCFCSAHRIGDDSKTHEPECADLRAALAAWDAAQ